jgi:hypothetical protein
MLPNEPPESDNKEDREDGSPRRECRYPAVDGDLPAESSASGPGKLLLASIP